MLYRPELTAPLKITRKKQYLQRLARIGSLDCARNCAQTTEQAGGFTQVSLARDGISAVHRFGFPAAERHRDGARHARAFHVSRGGPPEVVRYAIGQARSLCRLFPCIPESPRRATTAEQRSPGRVKAPASMEEEHPGRDSLSRALSLFATGAPPFNDFAKLRVLSERKQPPFASLGSPRFQPNRARPQINLSPTQREDFHQTPAGQEGEVANVLKLGWQMRADRAPFFNFEKTPPRPSAGQLLRKGRAFGAPVARGKLEGAT